MLQPFKIRMTRGWHLQTLWGKQQTHTDHQKTFPWKHYPAAEESASTLQQLVPCFTMTFNLTVTLLSGERADVEVDPDRTVIFLRRAAESQLKRPLKALLSAQGRLNGPSRICDAGLQDGDVITAIVREPGPVMESYRKARAFAAIKEDTVVTWGASEFGGSLQMSCRSTSQSSLVLQSGMMVRLCHGALRLLVEIVMMYETS